MAVLFASIPMVLQKLGSVLQSGFAKEHKRSCSLLKTSYEKLSDISAVITDAEERQLSDESMKDWVEKLADVVYDMEDLVDEILHEEATQAKPEAESLIPKSWARRFIPVSSSSKLYGEALRSKIKEIAAAIDIIDKQRVNFNLRTRRRYDQLSFADSLTSSYFLPDEPAIREEERDSIVRLLLSADETSDTVSSETIAIVGKDGSGKTSLAEIVYGDEKVSSHFDLKRWISLSDDFDIARIFRIITGNSERLESNLDLLINEIYTHLGGKKFLLVLDDLSSVDRTSVFVFLMTVLASGTKGSKIIFTTRSQELAAYMGCSNIFHLGPLTNDACWSVLAMSAFSGRDRSEEVASLEEIGREIVEIYCNGLPLYARVVGRLLAFEMTSEKWRNVLEELQETSWRVRPDNPYLPILNLSYHHLPSHLKRCFVYCSLFPRDYEFDKRELMLLWMAEGFLQHFNGLSREEEEVGAVYFDGLLQMSFFIPVRGSRFKFRMHHLMHEFAGSMSEGVCWKLESNNIRDCGILKSTRYLSLTTGKCDTLGIWGILEAKSLRTFLFIYSLLDHELCPLSLHELEEFLCSHQMLRVLSLASFQFSYLPSSTSKLKHLCYLDLSDSKLLRLPETIGNLCHLQTLKLNRCFSLTKLPQSIVELVNLRHLHIMETGLTEMPREMGRLKGLKTLTDFVLGLDGSNIQELGPLLELRGRLYLSGLQNVFFASDASAAMLKAKKYLTELYLKWSGRNQNPEKEIALLMNLEPSKELKELTIEFYGGQMFPSWLGDSSFSNVVSLSLRFCYNCKILPPLGQLPSLEHLFIESVEGVWNIGPEFCGISKPFQSLKTLTFQGMTQWEEWVSLQGVEFPCLQELCLSHCPNLKWVSLQGAEFPCLQELHLSHCPNLEGNLPKSLPSLMKLKIISCPKLKALLPRAPDTCQIELEDCSEVQQQRCNDDNLPKNADNLPRNDDKIPRNDEVAAFFAPSTSEISVPPHDGPSDSSKNQEVASSSSSASVTLKVSIVKKLFELPLNLLSLKIERCAMLQHLPMGILDKPSLQRLYIINCPSLKTFPQIHQPSSLRRLYIRNCRNLQFPLTKEMANLYILLEHLCLGSSCDSLKSFPLNRFPKLKILSLWDCTNLVSLSVEQAWQTAETTLDALEIRDCPNLTSFPEEGLQAPSLTSIIFSNCKNLYSLPRHMENFTSLQSLHMNNCPRLLELFRPSEMPYKLNVLCISACDKLTPQRVWQLDRLRFLSHFEIEGGCQEMMSFPEIGLLPTYLKSLRISSLLNLEVLEAEGLQQLTSLKTLEINSCNNLVSLPQNGLPSSLSSLSITDCSLLIPKLQDRKGEEWYKIAHIPSIHLD